MASVSVCCPSCSATQGVMRNGKSTSGHQRSALTAVKHGNSPLPHLSPAHTRKSLIWP